jgi:hypothetical protein
LDMKYMSTFTTILLCTFAPEIYMFSFTTILCALAPETYVQFHNYSSLHFCTWNICPVSQLFFSAILHLKFIFRFTNIILCASPPEIYPQFHNSALGIYDSVIICRLFLCYVLCSALLPCFIRIFLSLFPSVFLFFFFQTFSTVFRSLSWRHSSFFSPSCFHYLPPSNVRPAVSLVRFRLSLDGPTGCQVRSLRTSRLGSSGHW